ARKVLVVPEKISLCAARRASAYAGWRRHLFAVPSAIPATCAAPLLLAQRRSAATSSGNLLRNRAETLRWRIISAHHGPSLRPLVSLRTDVTQDVLCGRSAVRSAVLNP